MADVEGRQKLNKMAEECGSVHRLIDNLPVTVFFDTSLQIMADYVEWKTEAAIAKMAARNE